MNSENDQPGAVEKAYRWPDAVRCVAHLDLDCFYAAVEELLDPTLRGRPVAIVMGLDERGRGAVASASYAARAYGVHSALPVSEARKRCPELVMLPVRHHIYREHSARVMAILRQLAPLFQQVSIDEAFVELTGMSDPLYHLRAAANEIRTVLGLSCSLGVATSTLVAKMATNQGKPRGFIVVAPGQEAAFLAPLAVEALWGVGPRTAQRLREQGFATLGQIAAAAPADLSTAFGHRRALELYQGACGIDHQSLNPRREVKSISAEHTLGNGEDTPRRLWQLLRRMAEEVAGRLQSHGLVARTVGIKLRIAPWRLLTRDRTIDHGTADATQLAAHAAALMRENWRRGTQVRLIGLRASSLSPRPEADQLTLFPELSDMAR